MTHWAKVPGTKSEDLSSIHGLHMVENQLLQDVLWPWPWQVPSQNKYMNVECKKISKELNENQEKGVSIDLVHFQIKINLHGGLRE